MFALSGGSLGAPEDEQVLMRDREKRESSFPRLADLAELKEGNPRNEGVVSEPGEQCHIAFERDEPSRLAAPEDLRGEIDEFAIATPRSCGHRDKASRAEEFAALVEDRRESVE